MDAFARLHKAIDYLKDIGKIHIQRDIVAAISGNESNVTQALKGNPRYLTTPFLKRFARAYSDYINEDWLLTGEGEMVVPDKSLKPHFEAKAAAGFMGGVSDGECGDDLRPSVSGIKDYDFSIEVDGISMLPRIEDGDTLMCRISNDRLNPPIGKICVIDTMDGAVVKEIKKINADTITLHSINPDYTDYEVEFASILGIAEVVGLVRVF